MKMAATSALVTPDVVVTGITKLSETRVSRTVYDYLFQVAVKNNGTDAKSGVAATLTGVGIGATIVDGTVQVGNLAAGATVTLNDTITIRQDRTQPFIQSALTWQVTAVSIPPTISGVLLTGDPSQPADQATIDFVDQSPEDLATAQASGSGAEYYVSQLAAFISPGATVGQVNTVLNSISGRISYMRQNETAVTIHVPSPGSLAALQLIASNLMATGVFEAVIPNLVPQPQNLPINVIPADAFLPVNPVSHQNPVFHHIAARVTAAWNAVNVNTATSPVELIVIDYFGNDQITEINGTAVGILSGNKCNKYNLEGAFIGIETCTHGYHVLGIAAGSFGGDFTATGEVTGSLPKAIPLHVIDLAGPIGPPEPFVQLFNRRMREIITAAKPNRRFVINMSVGTNCPIPGDCLTASEAEINAKYWRKTVRNLSLKLPAGVNFNYENQVIQVSSAGNNGPTSHAERTSWWNAAVLLGPLTDKNGAISVPLTNGLVVENRTAEISLDPLKGLIVVPGPLNKFEIINKDGTKSFGGSTIGGNIGAIGTNIYSFISPTEVGIKSGTSMASPQVAGIAAYMLAIRPTISPVDLISRLKGTGQAPLAGAAPMMDAFAAILSLDNSFVDAPVRLAMLQPNVTTPKSTFGSSDASKFLQVFFPAAYPQIPALPSQPNFSQFDLNGDGFTGDDSKKSAFNLDFSPGLSPSGLILNYEDGGEIQLDRAQVTDFEVLCYYVHSRLFDAGGLTAFNAELTRIAGEVKRPVSCDPPKAKSFASISALPTSVVVNLPVMFTSVVRPTPDLGQSLPTGNVTFTTEGGATLCSATLDASGTGSCSAPLTTTGITNVFANYSGNSNYLPTKSVGVSIMVGCGGGADTILAQGTWGTIKRKGCAALKRGGSVAFTDLIEYTKGTDGASWGYVNIYAPGSTSFSLSGGFMPPGYGNAYVIGNAWGSGNADPACMAGTADAPFYSSIRITVPSTYSGNSISIGTIYFRYNRNCFIYAAGNDGAITFPVID